MKKIGILLIVWVTISTNALACGGQCLWPGAWLSPSIASDLNLTEDQKIRIQSVQGSFLEDTDPLRDALFTKREELRQLWANAHPDQAALLAKQREINDIRNQIEERMIRHQIDSRMILTPEQQERLVTLIGQHGRQKAVSGWRMLSQ